jgi:hypothetical protein
MLDTDLISSKCILEYKIDSNDIVPEKWTSCTNYKCLFALKPINLIK